MKPTTLIAVRRNTAIKAQSLVESPVLDMLRQEVPEGSMTFSFDPSVPANESLVFLVDDQGTREVDQHLERAFNLVHWAAKKISLPDEESGGTNPAIRITLIDDENETLSFCSVGIAASLDLIRTLRGDGPYEPPIPVVFRRIKTRSGFSTLKMKPVTTAVTPKK